MKKKILITLIILLILITAIIILCCNKKGKHETIIASIPMPVEQKEEIFEEEKIIVVELNDKQEMVEEPKTNPNEEGYTVEELENKDFYIKINNLANVVTIYIKEGEELIPYKAMICSTGTATPETGVYRIKNRWNWLALFGNVYGKYVTQIVGNILFHSVPYLEKKSDTLEYWEYDKLGTSASMGCIRLTVEDAKWIYDNIPKETEVEFYSSEEPGPLGKPEALKISENEEFRNWDPTDPDLDNPWNN